MQLILAIGQHTKCINTQSGQLIVTNFKKVLYIRTLRTLLVEPRDKIVFAILQICDFFHGDSMYLGWKFNGTTMMDRSAFGTSLKALTWSL